MPQRTARTSATGKAATITDPTVATPAPRPRRPRTTATEGASTPAAPRRRTTSRPANEPAHLPGAARRKAHGSGERPAETLIVPAAPARRRSTARPQATEPHEAVAPERATITRGGSAPGRTPRNQARAATAAPATTRTDLYATRVQPPVEEEAPRRSRASWPAATDAEPIAPSRALVPTRSSVLARPLVVEETATVMRNSRQMRALEARATHLPAPLTTAKLPVTVVQGGGTAAVPALHRVRPRGRFQTWKGAALAGLLSVAVLVAVLYAASPLTPGPVAPSAFRPLAAQLNRTPAENAPSGPWDTSVGLANVLGLGGGAGPGVQAPGTAGIRVLTAASQSVSATPTPLPTPTPRPQPVYAPPPPAGGYSAAPFQPWPPADPYMYVPGTTSFAVARPADGFFWWAFGQCTWWAQFKRRDQNLTAMGNALSWAGSAAARGYRVGSVPAPGSTVVFQPGVQGASGLGHVAHVEAVYPGGWFLMSEMNYYWNGGGWGRVDYRYAHTAWGVQFIY